MEQNEAERVVLGGMLLGRGVIDPILEIVTAGDFQSEAHAVIFEMMIERYRVGGIVDTVILREHLKFAGKLEAAGGDEYLLSLTDTIPMRDVILTSARAIRDKARARAAH